MVYRLFAASNARSICFIDKSLYVCAAQNNNACNQDSIAVESDEKRKCKEWLVWPI
jgi:hypothetical protein